MAARHAAVVATGRSDLPNQINNVLAFPGVFRGAIDAGATPITEGMKLAAATAIADVVGDDLRADYIVPSPLDRRVATAVAEAVAACARRRPSHGTEGCLAGEDGGDVAHGEQAHRAAGAVAGAAQVRGEHHVLPLQQPRVDVRLVLEDVQRRAAEPPARSASTRASVSTTPPRAVLTSSARGLIRASAAGRRGGASRR